MVEKQLVVHLQTRRQKTDIGSMMDGGGCHTVEPYRRMGASGERARVRQRSGGRPIRGAERHLILANAAFARESLREKWALRSGDGVKRKPSHLRQFWG